jgi:hypothetical protein
MSVYQKPEEGKHFFSLHRTAKRGSSKPADDHHDFHSHFAVTRQIASEFIMAVFRATSPAIAAK